MSEPKHWHVLSDECFLELRHEQWGREFRIAKCSVCANWIIVTETASGHHLRQATGVEEGLCQEIWFRNIMNRRDDASP